MYLSIISILATADSGWVHPCKEEQFRGTCMEARLYILFSTYWHTNMNLWASGMKPIDE